MENYSLGLALFDYLPVALAALGLSWLAQLLAHRLPRARRVLWVAVALVIGGGLSKASWKLLWVVYQIDLVLLDTLLFILLAPGLTLLACHVAAADPWRRTRAPDPQPLRNALLLLAPVALTAAFVTFNQPAGRAGFFTLLGAATLANCAMSAILIRWAWRCGQHFTAGIFLFSIVLILALSGLSRISAGAADRQWLAECLNALAHGSFALAVWRLRRSIQAGNTK